MYSTTLDARRNAVRPDETIIAEMTPLLEALCEDRLASEDVLRLESLVLTSSAARWFYVSYLDLHGSLLWDAGGVGSAEGFRQHLGHSYPQDNLLGDLLGVLIPKRSRKTGPAEV